MAHEINAMVYAGKVPWHGFGTPLPQNAPFEEIVQAAGFYEAQEKELVMAETGKAVPDRKALVRSDSGAYLSTVSTSYEVVQFADVARTLVEAAGDVKAIFHTAGTLGARGAKAWLLAELPDPIIVKGDPSPIRRYLVGVAGHDGMTAVTLKNVATRVVCANTLGSALSEDGAEWRVHHRVVGAPSVDRVGRSPPSHPCQFDPDCSVGTAGVDLDGSRRRDEEGGAGVDHRGGGHSAGCGITARQELGGAHRLWALPFASTVPGQRHLPCSGQERLP